VEARRTGAAGRQGLKGDFVEFFRIRRDIPFMRHALVFNIISLITFLAAVGFLAFRGLNLSIEFTGGTLIEVGYQQSADVDAIRGSLERAGYKAEVQNFGSSREVLIRMHLEKNQSSADLSQKVIQILREQDKSAELRRVEFVGPQIGSELVEYGALALLVTALGIVLYLWIRFEWRFGLSAIIANLHDVVIILGFFAFFQWEFSLPVLAAVLAVLGYSVNESVVVFDRVRENFRNRRFRSMPVPQVLDNAITATMSRTIITHGSTQLMVLSMLIFGGETLFYFALALTIGICFGIYSSVFVACAIVMWLGVSSKDLEQPEKKAKPEAVV
jgi:preprotein translocase subunit SecF